MTRFAVFVFLLAAIPFAAAKDVVHLKDGTRLAGDLTDGMLEVSLETPGGSVRIPWSEIDRIDRSSYVQSLYSERASKITPEDASAHFLLALWCRRQGLAEEMQAELEQVLRIDPEHAAARSALGHEKVGEKWVAGDQILEAKGFVRHGGRWVLREEKAYAEMVKERDRPLSVGEEKAEDLIEKAGADNESVRKFARTALEALSFEDVRLPLFRALGERRSGTRAAAAEELGRRGEREAIRPLLRSAILDRSPVVREAAVAALAGFEEPTVLVPLARALASSRADVRTRAAEAMGGLGDVRAIGYLVKRMTQNWGPTGRNNISVLNQVSYIRDFDVEIAQAAQIGDPIIGVLQEGVVLDVKVLGVNRHLTVVERQVIRSALARLSGVDHGDDAGAWAKWWRENRERLLARAG